MQQQVLTQATATADTLFKMIQIPKYILRPRPVSELRLHVEMQQQVLTQATATAGTLLKMKQILKYILRPKIIERQLKKYRAKR